MRLNLSECANNRGILEVVENKLLLFETKNQIIIITDLEFEVVSEPCGWRNKKFRSVTYLTKCRILGYNDVGDFVGEYGERDIEHIVRRYLLLWMKQNFMNFQKGYEAMAQLIPLLILKKEVSEK